MASVATTAATTTAAGGGTGVPARAATLAVSVPQANWDTPAWAAEWMTGTSTTYTVERAVDVAARYDVVAARPRRFAPYAAAMHAANPDLVLLVYTSGPFTDPARTDLPEPLYAHDATGARVRSRTFGTHLMNLHTEAWKAEQLRLCNAEVARSGYDGCFIDSMGNGILEGSYLSGTPIDPRTTAPYTPARWIRDARDVAAYVRARVSYPVVTNGLGSGGRYFTKESYLLATASDLAMAEAWLRAPHSPNDAWPTPSDWRRDVDLVADSEARGSGTLTVTKMWSVTGTSAAVAAQWYDFALGSFLLGSQGRSAMFFLRDGCTPTVCGVGAGDLATQPAPSLRLGAAAGAYAALGNGAFARAFVRGSVVVNPATATVDVRLPPGATYTDQDGRTLSGTVGVPAHDSLVLTHRAGATSSHLPSVDPTVPPPADPSVTCDGKPATLVGTRVAETLTGTAGDDVIVARHGNDVVDGLGGDDTVCAGDDDDTVRGGAGADRILGGNGGDLLDGGDGNDALLGADGPDRLYGGAGDDTLTGGTGLDVGNGGTGVNVLVGIETVE